jgi:hypothetical protein
VLLLGDGSEVELAAVAVFVTDGLAAIATPTVSVTVALSPDDISFV